MDVYSLDPLRDPRWPEFVGLHPRASVFHTAGWLRALERTYRFSPIAFTTSRPTGELRDALVFADVRSWLTGRRLVSLPFSDHCEPLLDGPDGQSPEVFRALCSAALRYRAEAGGRYVEVRPASAAIVPDDGFGKTQTFYLHRIDLRPELDALRRSFHKDSIQRKIRRAEREGLTYEAGRSEALLRKLHHLLDLTRRRRQVPLQPMAWFRNLVECLGESLCIRVVSQGDRPAAGILTLAHGSGIVYKYGGSDASLNPMGGMPFVFWKTIQEAKMAGAEELDLGRSDCDDTGLITFKEHLAAARSTLTYWRAPAATRSSAEDGWKMALAKRAFTRLPGPVRGLASSLLYRHFA